jgi:hypothetical protein
VAFYEQLGFRVVYRDAKDPVLVLKTESGVELNLIVNAPASLSPKAPSDWATASRYSSAIRTPT